MCRRASLCCAVLIVVLVPTVGAQPIDSLGRDLAAGHPGGAVIGLLTDEGATVRTFGTVDSTGRAPTARTIFEIGSITKTFTSLLLAERVERGDLRPGTPIERLLPDSTDVPDSIAGITLEHLATHRSALPRIPGNLRVAAAPADPYAEYHAADLLSFLEGHELARAPGSAYQYSNLGAGLLGYLLARRADTSYGALVRQRIARPLGLSDTRVRLSAGRRQRFAQGYNGMGRPTPPWQFDALAGAGAIKSTVADMLDYLRAHRRALRAESVSALVLVRAMRRALTPRARAGRSGARIGLGWHERERNGRRILWHNGGTGGFRSFAGFDRATGRGAVILVNAAISPRAVARAAFSIIEDMARR